MRRVLLHLGLHKTGTTAAQSFLYENRELIWPHYSLVLPYKTRKSGLANAATRHSVYRLDDTLATFGSKMNTFLGQIDFGTRRGLILSEENFGGLRPSRNRAEGYAAMPELASTLVGTIRRQLIGDEVDITIYLSLRERSEWLRSLWAHDLQRRRLVEDFDAFCAALDHLPGLPTVADRIQERLPEVHVQTRWLEDLQETRFGPGTPFAEFLGLPQDKASKLVPPSKSNTSLPQDALNELLALNRSPLEDTALVAQKKALIKSAQRAFADQT
ncbi:hypothetical protein ABLN87_18860 [Ruegeria sp. SCPT10]|uniref:hypothetical protein n=1 Tax=Ruegeria sp. SCP10 TaxID=3141377 RepID=UPI003339C798